MNSSNAASNVKRGFDLLLAESQVLSSRLGHELLLFRSISFAWLLVAVLGIESQSLRYYSVAIAALFTALLWRLVILRTSRSRERLMQALIQLALEGDTGELEKAYVEWQHSEWIDSRMQRVLSAEPFLWALITFVVLALRYAITPK